jgi:hypothetical protein
VVQGATAFSFIVADSTGPTVVNYEPAVGTHVDPGFSVTLTFSEGIQAGAGNVVMRSDGEGAITRNIPVNSNFVEISGNTMTIRPEYYFVAGTITVTMPSGVVTDDAHAGSASTNAFAGIAGTNYQFIVDPPPVVQAKTEFIDIGVAPGSKGCSYTLTHPWYTCHDFQECTLFVRPVGAACGSGSALQHKKVSMDALQKIAAHGFERNGGDGRDTVLNFAGGQTWPDNVVADFGGE